MTAAKTNRIDINTDDCDRQTTQNFFHGKFSRINTTTYMH